MDELERCPFCKGYVMLDFEPFYFTHISKIYCSDCGIEVTLRYDKCDEEKLVSAWNRRDGDEVPAQRNHDQT